MKNKKNIIIIISSIVIAAVLITLTLIFLLPKGNNIRLDNGQQVKIKLDVTKTIKYEQFNNGLVSFMIPQGWKVDVTNFDYIHYSFKVYNPYDENYMFLYALKLEGFNKSERARDWQKKYYPNQLFAKLPALDPLTTEQFYKTWNETAKYCNEEEFKRTIYPNLDDFSVIDKLGQDELGGDILRATYKNGNVTNEGIFMAALKPLASNMVSENIWNIFGPQIDVSFVNVYNIIIMSTTEEVFNNWQSILENCLNTLEFSQEFVNGFNKEENAIMANFTANQKIYNETSDMIMSSWEKRNNSYDIMSQKRSDATLGYERVYDTETGEIYKAYNGFTDDYSGNRYQPITDDMYTKTITGYIEK